MSSDTSSADQLLIERVRRSDQQAWAELIQRYEGRLLAFIDSRVGNRATAEDIVQETFIGFLNSLPNYDGNRSLEGYLFAICSFKLTDHLRRSGRRPAISLDHGTDDQGWSDVSGRFRGASSIARSSERRKLEEQAVLDALKEQITKWKEKGEWQKLMCLEMLFVNGETNKRTAELLSLTEQQVANWKADFISRTRTLIARQQLDAEVFPELHSQE
jgi:RNA polymerase sigma-70 factor, ECF subfamily